MYVEHNIEAHVCNHCCSGKAISITYSECVFIDVGIQPAERESESVRACVHACARACACVCACVCAPYFICGLPGSTVFFHIIS